MKGISDYTNVLIFYAAQGKGSQCKFKKFVCAFMCILQIQRHHPCTHVAMFKCKYPHMSDKMKKMCKF